MNPSRVFVAAAGVTLLLASGCDSKAASEASPEPSRSAAMTAEKASSWVKVGSGGEALQSRLKAEVGKAAERRQKPILYIGATWCEPCAALKKYKSDPRMAEAFEGTYVIELDLDDWKLDELKALGLRAGVVPVFHALGADGRASGKTIDGGAWGDNIPENMAPPLKRFFSG